ncbi:hypothetical protein [Halorubrum lacusprofundi]|jgi:hypothetical protein|nr:hypothetical protein [Halorubrum lacusprofundi]
MDPDDVPHDKFRDWVDENGYELLEHEDSLVAKGFGGKLEIHLTKYGNIHLVYHAHLGGEAGSVEFEDDKIIVTTGRGTEHTINANELPIPE